MNKALTYGLALTCCLLVTHSFAQFPETIESTTASSQGGAAKTISRLGIAGLTSEQRKRDVLIKEEAINMRQAGDEGSRERAKAKLEELLSRDYDDRLKGYEENLNRLEAELAEMRRRLQKRRDAKDEMIRLRIKVLQAEAGDLGWPERTRNSNFRFRRNFGTATSAGR